MEYKVDRGVRIFSVLIFMLGILTHAAFGRPSAGQAEGSGREKQEKVILPVQYDVNVILKLVQVSVVDKKGNPVRDLTKDDFVVYDNGKAVALSDFEKHTLGSLPIEADEKPAVVQPTVPTAPAAPKLNRKFFFFFDFAFNNERGVVKAREAALDFLDKSVAPEDEIAVLTYSMIRGLRVQEYLTRDHGKARKVIDNITRKDVAGRAEEIETRYWESVIESEAEAESKTSENFISNGGNIAYSWERQEGKRVAEFFIQRLTGLAQSLRQVQGTKYFLLFSSGMPASLVYGLQKGVLRGSVSSAGEHFDAGDSGLRDKNENMLKEFSASGCTFYSFDTRASAKVMDLFGYDSRTFEGNRTLEKNVFGDNTNIFQDEQLGGRNSLQRMSQVTGGEYFGNIDSHDKSFTRVENQTSSYYVLGYPVPEKEDGKFHDIKVEVRRPGCKIRGASGYFNPKPFSEFDREEKMLHLFDLVLNETAVSRLPERFPMRTVPVSAGEDTGLVLYGRLSADQAAKLSGGPLELVSVVFDSEDNVLDLRVGRTESVSRGPYLLNSFVSAKPGTYRCRLVARNMTTGRAAVSSVSKTVVEPGAANGGVKVFPPMLFETTPRLVFRLTTGSKGKGPDRMAGLYPFDVTELVPIMDNVEALGDVTVAAPCLVPTGVEGDLSVSAYLLDSRTGKQVPATFVLKGREKRGNMVLVTLGIPPAVVKPGSYVVYVNVRHPGTGATASGRASFMVIE